MEDYDTYTQRELVEEVADAVRERTIEIAKFLAERSLPHAAGRVLEEFLGEVPKDFFTSLDVLEDTES